MLIETEQGLELRGNLLVVAARSDARSSQLELHNGEEKWSLVIEGTFRLTRITGHEDHPATVESLLGQRLLVLHAWSSDGHLEGEFSNEWTLTVDADVKHEAWELFSAAGDRLVAVPANGIAVWKSGA